MRQTKEQLIEEIIKLRESHSGWVSGDEKRRQEFAKAFHWYKQNNPYYQSDRELRTPSWTEIFVEIGRILATNNSKNFEKKVIKILENHQERMDLLEGHIFKDKSPLNPKH